MQEAASPFSALLLVVFLAFLTPVFLSRLKRLRIPIVVGEIVAGIVLGQSGLKLVPVDQSVLNFLADFGFVYLMFLSGMEIDFSGLTLAPSGDKKEKTTWGPLPLALASFLLTLLMAIAIGWGMARAGLARNMWMMALVISTTSLGVVVPVLKETGLIGGRYGQTLLVSALVADFVTMSLITVLVAVLSHGVTFDVLLVGVLFLAFLVFLRFGLHFNRAGLFRRLFDELSHTTAQIKVRAAFTIMLVFVVLSEALGTEIILGAFLAGAIIALILAPGDQQIVHQLETIGYGFLIPIFFIMVGVKFNLSVLFTSKQALLAVPLLLVSAVLVKVLPGMVFRLAFPPRAALAGGILLSAKLSLIIAAAEIGVRLGAISETVNAAVLLVAILTVSLAPPLFLALAPPREVGEIRPIVVVGAGSLGMQVAQSLQAHQEHFVVVDGDGQRLASAYQSGFPVLEAVVAENDPRADELLNKAHTLICTHTDDNLNYRVCQVARGVYGIPHVVSHVAAPGDLGRFRQLGVRTTNAAMDRAALLVMLTRNPATYELLTSTDDSKEVFEVLVESPSCNGRMLHSLPLPGDTLVLALRRNGDLLVPHGNTQIETDDQLTVISSLEWCETVRRMFAVDEL